MGDPTTAANLRPAAERACDLLEAKVPEPLATSGGKEFWLFRPTAVRSLRKGDVIAARLGPNATVRATVDRLEDDEPSRIITVHALAQTGEPIVKKSRPDEVVDRFVEPDDGPPGSESRMVRGDELWKWIGVPLNDPEGSARKYMLRSFDRIRDDELGDVIRIKMQSGNRINTSDVFYDATFSFTERR